MCSLSPDVLPLALTSGGPSCIGELGWVCSSCQEAQCTRPRRDARPLGQESLHCLCGCDRLLDRRQRRHGKKKKNTVQSKGKGQRSRKGIWGDQKAIKCAVDDKHLGTCCLAPADPPMLLRSIISPLPCSVLVPRRWPWCLSSPACLGRATFQRGADEPKPLRQPAVRPRS